jgi:hypothetical protein
MQELKGFALNSRLLNFTSENQIYIIVILTGILLILAGVGISAYAGLRTENGKKFKKITGTKYLQCFEFFTGRFPLKVLSSKLNHSLGYFILDDIVQRKIVAVFTLLLPVSGLIIYSFVDVALKLWYTRLVTLVLCIVVPYYTFTLVIDYMKYNLRQKIPSLIDSFRSSFVSHNRIKPALQECCLTVNRQLGRIILRVSDSSDLNKSLCAMRDRVNDTWFNIFVALLINYRENGGELINQLYKLNKTITRYNNVEKKKNRRLIWYEIFTLGASIFSLPAVMLINKIILGANIGLYDDAVESFAKIVIYSLTALITVRILRRL